jgi:DtxR family Mn-dependent transcriptional regulator
MDNPISRGMSESEEMYLVTIASLVERGEYEPVQISRLAEELSILPVSANQMVHKLAEGKWVSYLPYRGVELTIDGKQIANKIIRKRRLWEVFLVERLGIAAIEASELACRFEHVTPSPVADSLNIFLDYPSLNPEGLPIPKDDNAGIELISIPLAELQAGVSREVVAVEVDRRTRAFLASSGIRPGVVVTPLAVTSGGDMLVRAGETRIQLVAELTGLIRVQTRGPAGK